MQLLTEEIISKFEAHPFHAQEEKGLNAEVLVKYFNPMGAGTWLITEAEREDDDWRLFGYCHLFEWEWGYLMRRAPSRRRPASCKASLRRLRPRKFLICNLQGSALPSSAARAFSATSPAAEATPDTLL